MNCKNCGKEIHPVTSKFHVHVHTGNAECRKEDLKAHRGTDQNARMFAAEEE